MIEPDNDRGKVLIIDDTVSIINMVKAALLSEGYQILIATSGKNGIKSARLARPDLILLDILMPEMDGYETCKHLKAGKETKDIPVLFMSALTDVFDKVKAFNIGAIDYVTKPLNVEELQARVNTQVKLSKMQRKLQNTNKWLEEKVEERTRELKESQQRYKTVADYTYDWEYWISAEDLIIYTSPSCKEVTGYSREEFINAPNLINEIIHEEDIQIWEEHRVKEYSKETKELVFRIRTKENQTRWIGHVCRQVFNENGEKNGIRVSNRDITGRIKAENQIKEKNLELKERYQELLAAEEEIRAINKELQVNVNKLFKSEERYKNFIRLSSEGIHRWEFTEPVPLDLSSEEKARWVTEKQYLAECNDAFAKMYGFEKSDEIIGKSLTELEKDKALEINKKLVEYNFSWTNFETVEIIESGEKRYFLNNLIGIIENDKVIRLWGTQANITKRKHAEIKTIENQHKLESIFRAAPAGIGVVVERVLVEVNPLVCKISGYSQEELLGKNAMFLYSTKKEYSWAEKETYQQIYKKGTGTVETKWKRKNGEIIDVLLTYSPINEEDMLKGVTFTVLDITEKQNALRLLEKEHAQLLSIFDNMDEVIYIADPETYELLYGNKIFYKNWGREIGRKCYKVLQGRDSPCPFCTNHQIFGENSEKTYIWEFKNEVNHRWYRCIDRAIKWTDGRMVRFEMAIDNHELKMTQIELEKYQNYLELLVKERTEELEASNEELETTNEELFQQKVQLEKIIHKLNNTQSKLIQSEKMASLGVLVAGVAHEINNPVNFINSSLVGLKNNLKYLFEYGDLLNKLKNNDAEGIIKEIKEKEDKVSLMTVLEMLNRSIEIIDIGIERTLKIVSGLKAFARSDEKKIESYDIHDSIENTLLILYNQYKNRIEILKEFGILPLVECYPSQINQVIMNVLNNAIQAIENKGKIEIRTAKLDNANVLIEIKDSGEGIPKDKLKYIFDPFYTTKQVGQGTGLGLSISYGIIKDHNGEIIVESELGQGANFKIILPILQ